MRILFTGGGTGGHFYPIIAVAQAIKKIAGQDKLIEPELYFMSEGPYNKRVLAEENIAFIKTSAGKWRRYFSIKNFLDIFKTIFGTIGALGKVFWLYPDVIFSKGAYPSVPAVLAGFFFRIPIVIHESDSHPGRANLLSSKLARVIAVSYPEAVEYFPTQKTIVTGTPLREEILNPIEKGAKEFLEITEDLPIIFILGGSQGSVRINDLIIDVLPELLNKYQVIHQTGKNNFSTTKTRADFILKDHPHKDRYKPFDYLNETAMRMVAGVADLVISRSGSVIFEIAYWKLPAILIPIPEDISHDQRTNAFTYASYGGAVVIEESNLTANIIFSEITRIMNNPSLIESMKKGAESFSKPNSADQIARVLLNICIEHEN